MAQLITIRTDYNALSRKLQASLKRYPRAAAAGINRAAERALTFSVREIQADIGASSQKTIRKNLSIWHATAEKPQAQVIAFSSKKDRVPIYELKPKPRSVTKRRPAGGVRYGPQNKLIPGSFIARMRNGALPDEKRSGHTGVFKRVGPRSTVAEERYVPVIAGVVQRIGIRQRPGGRKLRQQIAELYGPSVALVFSRKKIQAKLSAFIREIVPQEIERAFRFITG